MVSPLRAFIILSLCVGSCRSDPNTETSSSILTRIKSSTECRRFDSTLDGTQQVPPNEAQGECNGLMRLNLARNRLFYKIGCEGLSRKPTAIHIHQGKVGENGGVVVGLELTGIRRGRVAEGFIRASEIGDDEFESLITLIFEDSAYFNVYTPDNPAGEVRGQITTTSDCLEGEETTPDENGDETCNLPPEVGPCEALILRFYFDPSTNMCEEFFYGGCEGNANNFETEEECVEKCGGVLPPIEGEQPSGSPTPLYNYEY